MRIKFDSPEGAALSDYPFIDKESEEPRRGNQRKMKIEAGRLSQLDSHENRGLASHFHGSRAKN
jgi:hypothetical protein